MAYEVSEIMTATALQKTNKQLKDIQKLADSSDGKSQDQAYITLIKMIEKGQAGTGIEFGTGAKPGFIKKMVLTDSVQQNIDQATNMAASVSAAIAIRNYVKEPDKKLTIYLSGNKFHSDIKFLEVNAFGFSDYNSSDLMIAKSPGKVNTKAAKKLNTKKEYYGISLKKKKTVSATNPTLINKAVSTLFDGKEYDEMVNNITKVRVKYFADLVRTATETKLPGCKNPILRQQDIAKSDWSSKPGDNGGPNDLKLMKAENKDVNIWGPRGSKGKTYIDTKGYYDAPIAKKKGSYISDDRNITDNPKSMRYWVNKQLNISNADKKHKLWSEYIKAIQTPWKKVGKDNQPIKDGASKLAYDLLNIILKLKLYDQLDAKVLNGNKFRFALITAIGEVKKLKSGTKVSIDDAKTYDLKTTLCGMSRIDEQNEGDYKVVFDKAATEGAEAAKIFFKIMKGKFNIMDLRIRYKGKFNPRPQFQAYMTADAQREFLDKCSG